MDVKFSAPSLSLYAKEPEFRGFMYHWLKDKRCPFPLADYLLDHGLESQARCALWCATEPDMLYADGTKTGKFPFYKTDAHFEADAYSFARPGGPLETRSGWVDGEKYYTWFVHPKPELFANGVAIQNLELRKVLVFSKYRILAPTATSYVALHSESETAAILKLLDSWK